MASFCDHAWQRTTDLRASIHALPFNRELAAGTLEQKRFQFYITQDALYLEQYTRILALAGVRGPDAATLRLFAESALGAVAVEQALHEQYLARFGVRSGDPGAGGAVPRLPELHQFPAGHRLSRAVGGAGGGIAAVLLDLLGCWERDRPRGRRG